MVSLSRSKRRFRFTRMAIVKFALKILLLVSSLAVVAAHTRITHFQHIAVAAQPRITHFQHIIVVFQENRTPDNLFYALCANFPCSTNPNTTQYNIQTANWLDKTSFTGVTQPTGVALANGYDLDHTHDGWSNECDLNTNVHPPQCRMDGAAGTYPNRGAFVFVNNTVDAEHPLGILAPYLTLVTTYGWANFMFQTNQGPSFPAHQYIFGGTSARNAAGDKMGEFISENFPGGGAPGGGPAGCYAKDGDTTKLINSAGVESLFTINYAAGTTTCFTRTTMADLLDHKGIGWKYYSTQGRGADRGGHIWTAPNAIQTICVPDGSHQNCTGTEWANHVDLTPAHVLNDLGANSMPCNLQGVSWVIPDGHNSDHAGGSSGGPDWVGSIVNALGNSPCTEVVNGHTLTYWQDTAVVISWDDFGGWYDHVPPTILPSPEGGYQLGFRVPLIFVSAYTPSGYIDNSNHDFGTVLRFIEHNFGLGVGALGFADSRGIKPLNSLTGFYNLGKTPRQFVQIPTTKTALDFINDKAPPTDPDDD
jgi:phospholipase C